ncbi:uncharacterized protein [Epargyreus clarus]|uniref:uncharacterized protein n=1 Tax=Epargyreus clarus TaxID=520877 RepID=UPI003C2EBC79
MYLYLLLVNMATIYGETDNNCGSSLCNKSSEHVNCKFQLEGSARHCINYERTIKSESDKQLVLEKINLRRNKVAAGEIRSLRPAENMMKLHWNEELAVSAQTWADQCVEYSIPDVQDICRELGNSSVGQNIATIYGDSPGLTPVTLVDLWYIELLDLNSSLISRYQRSSVTGSNHYDYFTQLMWAETSEVGCGAVKFTEQDINEDKNNKSRTVYRLVCNFAPAGNQVGRPVYTYGLPCSRCPSNGTCDPVYKALCGKTQNKMSRVEINQRNRSIKQLGPMNSNLPHRPTFFSITEPYITKLEKDVKNFTGVTPVSEQNVDYDENISYDLFSDLLEQTTTTISTYSSNKTTICKEILVVDDLFEILKKKLSTDQTLRDLLLTGKSSQNETTEEPFTDSSVAAIMSRIYKNKETMTATKTTNNEYINSTLLVDLVEAVIFRNNDKISTSDVTESNTQSNFNVKPIKIQAELGEIGSNTDFTGHYFFPEDNNDESSSDVTEDYYDTSEISVSDVAFEIEDLRRNKGTKDFLEEILESDFVTEAISQTQNNEYSSHIAKKDNEKEIQYTFPKIRSRRRNSNDTFVVNSESGNIRERRKSLDRFFSYNNLLKKLASDLKLLKLNDQFHCSKNKSVKQVLSTITLFIVIMEYIVIM